MDPSPSETPQMVPVLEGAQKVISAASRYLDDLGIENSVSLAEDCQPGS